MLYEYMQQTQRFLRDAKQDLLNPADLISYINRARREVAMRAQCIRRLTPISGSCVSVTVTNGGSGYVAPVCTISAPDFPSGVLPYPNGSQATALPILTGDVITAIDVQYGGSGYFMPTITITDSAGTGATATVATTMLNELQQGQEVYPFSNADLTQFPGVQSIYMIKSASIIYSNYRYSLPMYSFSTYQAMIRQYMWQYQWVPTFMSQYGQGVDGSFYMYPLPSQAYLMEWDCLCLPQDLTSDASDEALPAPWTDAVPYFAAHLSYLELQNFNFAKGYLDLFDQFIHRYSAYARPGRVTNPYGRY